MFRAKRCFHLPRELTRKSMSKPAGHMTKTTAHDGSPELCGLSGYVNSVPMVLASTEKTASGVAEDQGPLLELRANFHGTAVAVPVLAGTQSSRIISVVCCFTGGGTSSEAHPSELQGPLTLSLLWRLVCQLTQHCIFHGATPFPERASSRGAMNPM